MSCQRFREWVHDVRRAVKALFCDVDYRDCEAFRAATSMPRPTTPRWDDLAEEDTAARRAALLAHAQAVMAQLQSGLDGLDKKAEEAFKFTATLMAALIAYSSAANPRTTTWMYVAAGFWLAAAFVFGLMRKSAFFPGLPNTAKVRDGVFCVESHQEWLAESLHLNSIEMREVCYIRGTQLNLGIGLLLISLVFLLIHFCTLNPSPPAT